MLYLMAGIYSLLAFLAFIVELRMENVLTQHSRVLAYEQVLLYEHLHPTVLFCSLYTTVVQSGLEQD